MFPLSLVVHRLTLSIVLSCESHADPQIRIIINDGVVPLTGIHGCPEDKDGKIIERRSNLPSVLQEQEQDPLNDVISELNAIGTLVGSC